MSVKKDGNKKVGQVSLETHIVSTFLVCFFRYVQFKHEITDNSYKIPTNHQQWRKMTSLKLKNNQISPQIMIPGLIRSDFLCLTLINEPLWYPKPE